MSCFETNQGRGCGGAGAARRQLPRPQVAAADSKTWSHLEEALLALSAQLADLPLGTPKEAVKNALRAAVFLVRRAARDIVTPVRPRPACASRRWLAPCPVATRAGLGPRAKDTASAASGCLPGCACRLVPTGLAPLG